MNRSREDSKASKASKPSVRGSKTSHGSKVAGMRDMDPSLLSFAQEMDAMDLLAELGPTFPPPRKPLYEIKFGMNFLHTTDQELWGKICKTLETFIDQCEAWKLNNPSDLANAVQKVRAVSGRASEGLIAFKNAVASLKEKGVCEVVAFCGPVAATLALLVTQLPALFPAESYPEGLPFLLRGTTNQVFLSRRQIAALLAATLFAALPDTPARIHKKFKEPPDFEFGGVYDIEVQKSICLLSYFHRIATADEAFLDQVVSFGRRFEAPPPLHDWWMQVDKPLFRARVEEGPLEASHHSLQVDFSNEVIGGAVLEGCYGQEEIRFVICPECLVSRLFCDKMGPNEALFIAGARQYSQYSGRDREFTFESPFLEEPWSPDKENRCGLHLVAIDPLEFPGKAQYEPANVVRDCLKTYVACLGDPSESAGKRCESLATGNWGCGMWGGDPQLKFLIQWLAASANERELVYYPFGEERLEEIEEIIDKVWHSGARVGDLYKLLHSHKRKRGVFVGLNKNIDSLISAGILVPRPQTPKEPSEHDSKEGSRQGSKLSKANSAEKAE